MGGVIQAWPIKSQSRWTINQSQEEIPPQEEKHQWCPHSSPEDDGRFSSDFRSYHDDALAAAAEAESDAEGRSRELAFHHFPIQDMSTVESMALLRDLVKDLELLVMTDKVIKMPDCIQIKGPRSRDCSLENLARKSVTIIVTIWGMFLGGTIGTRRYLSSAVLFRKLQAGTEYLAESCPILSCSFANGIILCCPVTFEILY